MEHDILGFSPLIHPIEFFDDPEAGKGGSTNGTARIVGLLAAKTTYLQGIGYLGLYNLAFVAPLLIILAGVGNRRVMHRIRVVEQSSRRWVRLATGVGMVAVGVVILIWFV